MKTKRKTPDIRFRGFSDDWEQRKLGEVTKFKQGVQVDLDLQCSEKTEEMERFIRIVDYTQSTDELRYVRKDITYDRVDEKDIVMVRYGATAGFVGRGINGIIANNMFTISPNEDLKKTFLYTFLKMEKTYTNLNSSNGSSAMPALNFGMVGRIELSYPTQAEQEKIGAYFTNLDNLITLHQRKLQQLKEVKRGMLYNLFPQNNKLVPNIRCKNHNKDWMWVELGRIATFKTGASFNNEISENGTFTVMDMGSISSEGKRIKKKKSDILRDGLNVGDLVMPKDDIGGGNIIGKTAYIPADNSYVLGDHVYRLRFPKNNGLFMHYRINSTPVNNSIKRKVTGSAQLGINQSSLAKIKLLIPEFYEQKKMSSFLEKLDRIIELQEREIELLEETKKGFLQKMFV